MEEIQLILDDTRERMEKSVQFLVSELKKIRAGKASPSMLDGISVDYYGAPTPLVQVASITSPDPRTLFIKPWEKTIIQDIEKAIMNSELGLSPQNDGENIIINILIEISPNLFNLHWKLSESNIQLFLLYISLVK